MSAYARALLVLTAFVVAVLISMDATLGVAAGVIAVIVGVLLDRFTDFCSADEDEPAQNANGDRRPV
jgi:hypothetical protein